MIVIRVTEDKPVSIGKRQVFGASYDGGEKRICDIRNDHPDHVGLVPTQSACKLTGLIAKRLDSFENTAPERFANPGRTIENVRHCAERNIGHLRDLLHVWHSLLISTATVESLWYQFESIHYGHSWAHFALRDMLSDTDRWKTMKMSAPR